MTPRIHSVVFGSALALASWLAPTAFGQQAAPAGGSVAEELRSLRQLIEQQSKQIDTLTAQITRLGGELERRNIAAPATSLPAPAAAETSPAPESAAPAPAGSAPTPPTAKVVAPSGNVHIVVKGDSLEKIAKQHNTTITELQKLNKITDPKKLQIGQQINLPSPSSEKPQ